MLRIILLVAMLPTLTGCVAQRVGWPTTATVRAFVHEPDGKPVEGAKVHLSLPRFGPGEADARADATTDFNGVAAIAGIAHTAYRVWVDKEG